MITQGTICILPLMAILMAFQIKHCFEKSSLKKFDPPRLVVEVENLVGTASVSVALDDDSEKGAEHDGRLERVGPHDCLYPALGQRQNY